MKSETKKLPKSQIEIIISEIDSKILENGEAKALRKLSSQMKIKGFRKGNVPETFVREKIDPQELKMESLHEALPEIWKLTLEQNSDVNPIKQPELNIESLEPLKIKWTVTVQPKATVGDYKKIKVEKKEVKISDKEVKETLEKIQKQLAIKKDVEREAKKGDHVEIDFEGKTPDGVPLENTNSKNHPVILGEGVLLEEFEKNVEGMKIGEEKEFKMIFPKDYHAKNMAGKEVVFKVKMNAVKEVIPAEINKEFAKQISGKEMEETELKDYMKEQLLKDAEAKEKTERTNAFLDKLVTLIDVEIPDFLIEHEQDNLLRETKQRMLYGGISFEQYLQHMKKTEEELKNEFKKEAEERVKLQLAFNAIAEKENPEVTEKEMEEEILKRVERLEKKEQDKAKDGYKRDTTAYLNLKHQMKIQKTIDQLLPK